MKKRSLYLLALSCLLIFASCEDPDSSPRALLNVMLVDSPAKWDSVFVEIKGVDIEVLVDGRDLQSQTFFFEYKSGNKRIKVSELVGGNSLLLGRNALPIGQVINATIILGEDHSMFLDERKYDLKLSDPMDNQISLPTDIDMEQGISYDIFLDIDLEKSIVQTSESPLTYTLKPTFKLVKGASAVELSGVLKPTALYPAIYLFNEKDTFSTHTNPSGKYFFRVAADKYMLYFDPKNELYQSLNLEIDLSSNRDSVLKDIIFELKP